MLRLSFFALCLAAIWMPFCETPAAKVATSFSGWPNEWDGRPLSEIPLSESDRGFNNRFPGEMAKFTDGEREFFFRWIAQGSRQLHSSSDCFRGSGFTIRPLPASLDAKGGRWSCFSARRGHESLLLKERITDASGGEWTDVSAWFWSVFWNRTRGPWLAVTMVESEPTTR